MISSHKQTIINIFFNYLGSFLGAFYMLFLIPIIFDNQLDNYGGLVSLINLVSLYSFISLLATPNTIIKYYPNENKENKENLISFLMLISICGTILSCIIFYFGNHKPIVFQFNKHSIELNTIFYLLIISQTLNSFLTGYCLSIQKTNVPTFLNNTFLKIFSFLSILLLFYDLITIKTFVFLYFTQYILVTIFFITYTRNVKTDVFKISFKTPKNIKEIIMYSIFNIFTAASISIVTKIDTEMIRNYIDQTGVTYYSYVIFFVMIMLIPKNSISSVSKTIISRDIIRLDSNSFKIKYQRISIIYFTTTLIVFLGIMINLDDILSMLGTKFNNTDLKVPIIILGIGRLLESICIPNYYILQYSKYYKTDIIFQAIGVSLVILLNIILIPKTGLVGAALSSALVFIFNGVSRSLYIYKKYQLIPLGKKYILKCALIASLIFISIVPIRTWLGHSFFETSYHYIIPIIIRSAIFGLILFLIIEVTNFRKEFINFKKKTE